MHMYYMDIMNFSTQQNWQIICVCYVLDDSNDDSSSFLVYFFVEPKWIHTIKSICNNIVKSQKHVLEKSDS